MLRAPPSVFPKPRLAAVGAAEAIIALDSACDMGVIDLYRMNRVEIDSARRVAHAQAGAVVPDMDQATQRFDLATHDGWCPTVGIAGLTLGGGTTKS